MEVADYELYQVPPRWVFLKLETTDGTSGWGEPIVEGRTRTVCAAVSELLEDYILGTDPTETVRSWYRIFHGDHYRNGPILMSALAGIDQALWDIVGRSQNQPVYDALGGPVRDKVRVYQWLTGEQPEELVASAEEAVDDGYTALGMMAHTRPSRVRTSEIITRVEDRVAAVREAIGDSIDLAVDFRGRVSAGIARQLLSRLEKYNLMFVEEPVLPENNDDLPEVAQSTTIPIATGQRMYSRWDFKEVLENRSIEIAQPAVSHAGGITETMKIGSMAEAHNVMLMPKCSVGPISFASAMHIQMAAPNAVLQEQHDDFYAEQENHFFNYIRNNDFFSFENGFMKIPERPGLGIKVNEDHVREQSKMETQWQGPVWHYEDGSVANW